MACGWTISHVGVQIPTSRSRCRRAGPRRSLERGIEPNPGPAGACCGYAQPPSCVDNVARGGGAARWDTRRSAPKPDVRVRTHGVSSSRWPPSLWPPSEEAILVYSAPENHHKHLSCKSHCLKYTSRCRLYIVWSETDYYYCWLLHLND